MKKLLPTLLVLAFFSSSVFGQLVPNRNSGSGTVANLGQPNGLISGNHRFETIPSKQEITYQEALAEYEKIKGSPFLHGGKITVDLISHKDSIYKNVTILYDLYNNEVIVKQQLGEDIILNQAYYKGFTYNNDGIIETYLRVHPSNSQYFQVLFQNKDFAFCKEIKTAVEESSIYIPSDDGVKQSFTHRKRHLIINKKLVLYGKLRNEGLIENLPFKYRKLVPKLKKELKIKRINKEKDYLKIMEAFPKPQPIDQTKEEE